MITTTAAPPGRVVARFDLVRWLMAPAPPDRLDTVRVITVGYCLVWIVARVGFWRDSAALSSLRFADTGLPSRRRSCR